MNQTLSQICKELKLSRKVIQGYEKHGLIRSCGKDRYGHLVYDRSSIERIIEIRFYQKLGFSLKEIRELDKDDLKEVLKKKKEEILKEKRSLEKRLSMIESMINGEIPDPETMRNVLKEESVE